MLTVRCKDKSWFYIESLVGWFDTFSCLNLQPYIFQTLAFVGTKDCEAESCQNNDAANVFVADLVSQHPAFREFPSLCMNANWFSSNIVLS